MVIRILNQGSRMTGSLRYKLRIRIFRDEKVFGPGMAELAENITKTGSLRAAAAEMGMAYSKAWKLLRIAESSLGFKLLCAKTGGRGGGGMVLTPDGTAFLEAYRAMERELGEYADKKFAEHFAHFIESWTGGSYALY